MPLSHCDTWIVDRQWAYSVQRVPDCLGGLSRVGISSRSTRPWNGQPPSITLCDNIRQRILAPNHERHDVITRALRENYASISRKFTQPVYSIFLGQQERARAFSSTLWRYFLRNGLDETDSFMQLHHPALLHNLSTELHYTVSSVCLLHEQVFASSGWEAEIHTGHIQQCWHTLHRWEEHGRSENIYHRGDRG